MKPIYLTLFLSLFLIISFNNASAQKHGQSEIDSLKARLATEKRDTARLTTVCARKINYTAFFTSKPTGQSLSLSYDIVVKAHSGKINVESKEGEGTVFMVALEI